MVWGQIDNEGLITHGGLEPHLSSVDALGPVGTALPFRKPCHWLA